MGLKALVKGDKTITDDGSWAQGTMPKTAFPLSKQASFRVGPRFRWRLTKFTYEGATYRLLVFYRLDISKFTVMLGREDGSDMCVLARYEFHADHPGWHFHTNCRSSAEIAGRTGNLNDTVPKHGKNRNTEFGITDDAIAHYVAMKRFGLLPKTLFKRA